MKDLLQILQIIRDTHGADVFADAGQLRALLADYTAGQYKGERRIFLLALEDGLVVRLRRESDVVESFLRTQARYFATTYFLSEEAAQGVVWCWVEILGLRVEGKAVLLRDAPGAGGMAITTAASSSTALAKSSNRDAAWVFWVVGLLFIIGIAAVIINSQHQQELAREQARQQQLAEDQIRQRQLSEELAKEQALLEQMRQQQLAEEQVRQQHLAEEQARQQQLEKERKRQQAEERKPSAIPLTVPAHVLPNAPGVSDQKDASTQFKLGWMYYEGDGVQIDEKKAIELWQKAAEQGHAGAQFQLGAMYHFGPGVQKDSKKAVEGYQKAAGQGHAGAKNNLDVIQRQESRISKRR
jgi:hypothetical protein